ncbi:MAG: DUF420 domain-containing protein [Candidatus Heimdallarchaeota archaeon]|nr:DUF420 domain-containing protein [Candidatus Heimdallarchaeota archaeon]
MTHLAEAHPLAISGFLTIALGLYVLVWGYRQAKAKNFKKHRQLMITAAFVLAAFLVQYIFRAGVLRETTTFEGPRWIRNFVYIPILVVHISFAILTIISISIHLRRALSHELRTDQDVPYFPKDYRKPHRSMGKRTFQMWLISYVGGIIVFTLLYIIS